MTDPLRCPACQEEYLPGTSFCESCGATIEGLAGAAVHGTAAEHRAATLPTDAATNGEAAAGGSGATEPGAHACRQCGGAVLDDGYCSECGTRAPSPRDRWTESPTAWVGGVCDKGIVHLGNEDAMALHAADPAGSFATLVVCDGVTTAPLSDRASLAACTAARDWLITELAGAPATPSPAARVSWWSDALAKACALAQRATIEVASALNDPPEPPSCTFAAGVVHDGLLVAAWCGDSRIYWLPDAGEPRQMSRDHSLGTQMIDSGIAPDVAEADPTSHTITRWLGADSVSAQADLSSVEADEPGWFLVCSDGLWNYVSAADRVRSLITDAQAAGCVGPTEIADSLVAFANNAGGHDNITVALARIQPVETTQEP